MKIDNYLYYFYLHILFFLIYFFVYFFFFLFFFSFVFFVFFIFFFLLFFLFFCFFLLGLFSYKLIPREVNLAKILPALTSTIQLCIKAAILLLITPLAPKPISVKTNPIILFIISKFIFLYI